MQFLLILNFLLLQAPSILPSNGSEFQFNTLEKTLYKYVVNYQNEGDLESVKNEIKGLINVTEVKLVTKSENKIAQILIYVEETRIEESQEMFSIKPVKDLILTNNLTPVSYTFEKLK